MITMNNLDKVLEKFWKTIKDKPNVVGYSGSLKPKIRRDEAGVPVVDAERQVVRIYVSKKIPEAELRARDLVPRSIIDGSDVLETDIIEIGEIKALCQSPSCGGTIRARGVKDRIRPLEIGISAMGVWQGCTACTLGGFAKNKKEGEDEFIGILANNHCAAQENKAPIGCHYIQPSKYDGGQDPQDQVGTLWRFVEIKFNEFACPYRNSFYKIYRTFRPLELGNAVDIAFVKLDPGIEYKLEIYGQGPLTGKREAMIGDEVEKVGRTTGHTANGVVEDIDWTGFVAYSRGRALFRDCVLVVGDLFSQGGDSSSLTYTTDKEYIGNLFGGSDSHSIICKLGNIERELEVEVLI